MPLDGCYPSFHSISAHKSRKQVGHIQRSSSVTYPSLNVSGGPASMNFAMHASQWSWSQSSLGGEYFSSRRTAPRVHFALSIRQSDIIQRQHITLRCCNQVL